MKYNQNLKNLDADSAPSSKKSLHKLPLTFWYAGVLPQQTAIDGVQLFIDVGSLDLGGRRCAWPTRNRVCCGEYKTRGDERSHLEAWVF